MKSSGNVFKRVVLIDTGPLVAAIYERDCHHSWAKSVLPQLAGRIQTCEAVAAEALHLLDNAPGAIEALQKLLSRMEIVPVLREEFAAVFSAVGSFAPRMDLADGCLVALSARHRDAIVITTDTRDFSSYRIAFASPEGLFALGDFPKEPG